jgi:uncharacterized membrane protein YphA (DoxX/SURF4 family)
MAIGSRILGVAAILAGGEGLAFLERASTLPPASHPFPTHAVLNTLLILGGIAINLGRRAAGAGAIGLAAVFALSGALLQGPVVLQHPTFWGAWQGLAEFVAMTMGGVIAWSLLGEEAARRGQAAGIARVVFGLCLLVFGISHFVYLKFTASLVPAWLPPSQTAWAGLTGAAHVAAGLAILSGVKARLAAILLTAMFAGFGLLVHIPWVMREPSSSGAWSEAGVNLLLVGAAWCVADSLAATRRRESMSPIPDRETGHTPISAS